MHERPNSGADELIREATSTYGDTISEGSALYVDTILGAMGTLRQSTEANISPDSTDV